MKRMNKILLVAALAATTLSAQAEQKKGPAWLSDALFYQIYPSSYMDTDGNGIGDFYKYLIKSAVCLFHPLSMV